MRYFEQFLWSFLTFALSFLLLSFIAWKNFTLLLESYLVVVVLVFAGIPIIWMLCGIYAKIYSSEKVRVFVLDKWTFFGVALTYLLTYLHILIPFPVVSEYYIAGFVCIHLVFWILLFTRLKYKK